MKAEGGFQGRTNKLVDGCYSFWQVSDAIKERVRTLECTNLANGFHTLQGGTAVLVELVRLGEEATAVAWITDPVTGQRVPYQSQDQEGDLQVRQIYFFSLSR